MLLCFLELLFRVVEVLLPLDLRLFELLFAVGDLLLRLAEDFLITDYAALLAELFKALRDLLAQILVLVGVALQGFQLVGFYVDLGVRLIIKKKIGNDHQR
ncbi:MAG: hypothetical protein K2J77_10080, partial [Oscillospiraceae bacterium]|nr:hypothetical protein [Oscillospiraceae bacterium]